MPRMTLSKSAVGFGPSMEQQTQRTAQGSSQVSVTVPVGKTGTLSTRTNNSDGTLTLTANHGIETGDVIDLYWSGGSRRNVTVGTVSVNSVPISSGAGTNLPVQATAIVASPQVDFNLGIVDTSDLLMTSRILLYSGVAAPVNAAIMQLLDVGEAISTVISVYGNKAVVADIEGGDATDLTEDSYLTGKISNPSSSDAATLQMAWLSSQ